MKLPVSTYRIQLNADFTLKDLDEIIPYLHQLGISTVYVSPIFRARPGSTHGYDVASHGEINAAIGSEDELCRLSSRLRGHQMNFILDIVPNHMVFDSCNPWIQDILLHGPASDFADYFDIDWDHPEFKNKVMAPLLGEPLADAIEARTLKLEWNERPEFVYYNSRFPINLAGVTFIETKIKYPDEMDVFNDNPQWLTELHDLQHYVLAYWKETEERINYRRFFTINDLICLQVEIKHVFEPSHAKVGEWIQDGVIDGLRVDHIDGLKFPGEYLTRLRKLAGEDAYIIVEKVLAPEEHLPAEWPVEGTSGYEFLAAVNGLLCDSGGYKILLEFYRQRFAPEETAALTAFHQKHMIIRDLMTGELNNLVRQLMKLEPGLPENEARDALAAIMAGFPVYRMYLERDKIHSQDAWELGEAYKTAMNECPDLLPSLNKLYQFFLTANALPFIYRMQQFTGPLMAKGVEDTTFYNFIPLISRNEVGDEPDIFIDPADYHCRMGIRMDRGRKSLNATATHDTKRGEDNRLRISALTEFPEAWKAAIEGWMQHLRQFRDEMGRPDEKTIYFFLQSMIGAWPEDMEKADEDFIGRMKAVIVKAVREAKERSSWARPDKAFESALEKLVEAVMKDEKGLKEYFFPVYRKVTEVARKASLVQVGLKITSPGIPDIYQGCELWELSMVDPDNRRPVDFNRLKKLLDDINRRHQKDPAALAAQLMESPENGAIKMMVLHLALQQRRKHPDLFSEGKYIKLDAGGIHGGQILAYARRLQDDWCITVTSLSGGHADWGDTSIALPEDAPDAWQDIFTGKSIRSKQLRIKEVLDTLPVAILIPQKHAE